jgi:multiple sugar transport system permease protein
MITSLKNEDAVVKGPFYIPFIDYTPSLDAWKFILADPYDNLLIRYFNSTVVGVIATALTLLLGTMLVYGLTRLPIKLWGGLSTRGIMAGVLATRILPPIILVLPLYMMAVYTRTLDTRFALIITYTAVNLPVAVWLLQPVFGGVATDQEEAAQLDGASRLSIFFTIFLPMVVGSVFAIGLLIFILCWNEYLFAAYLADNNALTLPPWLVGQMSIKEAQVGSEAQEWSNFSAATILMATPLLACTAVVQRFLGRAGLWGRRD